MGRAKQPSSPVENPTYAGADIYERFHNREFFYECCREGLRRAMLAHQEINNKVAIWKDGQVVLVPAGEVLKDLDVA